MALKIDSVAWQINVAALKAIKTVNDLSSEIYTWMREAVAEAKKTMAVNEIQMIPKTLSARPRTRAYRKALKLENIINGSIIDLQNSSIQSTSESCDSAAGKKTRSKIQKLQEMLCKDSGFALKPCTVQIVASPPIQHKVAPKRLQNIDGNEKGPSSPKRPCLSSDESEEGGSTPKQRTNLSDDTESGYHTELVSVSTPPREQNKGVWFGSAYKNTVKIMSGEMVENGRKNMVVKVKKMEELLMKKNEMSQKKSVDLRRTKEEQLSTVAKIQQEIEQSGMKKMSTCRKRDESLNRTGLRLADDEDKPSKLRLKREREREEQEKERQKLIELERQRELEIQKITEERDRHRAEQHRQAEEKAKRAAEERERLRLERRQLAEEKAKRLAEERERLKEERLKLAEEKARKQAEERERLRKEELQREEKEKKLAEERERSRKEQLQRDREEKERKLAEERERLKQEQVQREQKERRLADEQDRLKKEQLQRERDEKEKKMAEEKERLRLQRAAEEKKDQVLKRLEEKARQMIVEQQQKEEEKAKKLAEERERLKEKHRQQDEMARKLLKSGYNANQTLTIGSPSLASDGYVNKSLQVSFADVSSVSMTPPSANQSISSTTSPACLVDKSLQVSLMDVMKLSSSPQVVHSTGKSACPPAQTTKTVVAPAKPALNLNKTFEKVVQSDSESYEMTPVKQKVRAPSTNENYNINDLHSDDSTDEEDRPRKTIPIWAHGTFLKAALIKQFSNPIDTEKLFGQIDAPDLNQLFTKKKARFNKRTSSAVWDSPIYKPRTASHTK